MTPVPPRWLQSFPGQIGTQVRLFGGVRVLW